MKLESVRGREKWPHRLSERIKNRCWAALTRRLDGDSLRSVLRDPKGDGQARLYLPAGDTESYEYYKEWSGQRDFELLILPERVTPDYVLSLNSKPGLLGLGLGVDGPRKYVVPGGRFQEMYGWDSYFIALGLVRDGLVDLAQEMVDQLVYEVERYGAILNANRTYYLTRSQPPFLTSLLRLFPETEPSWIERGLRAAVFEYDNVWTGPNRLMKCGLSRYYCSGIGYPPETLLRHYGSILKPYADALNLTVEGYRAAYLARRVFSPELDAYFKEDRAVRESGHDTSYRLEGICTRLCTVDLNSLLYRYERDLADILLAKFPNGLDGIPPAEVWCERAQGRQRMMTQLCWSRDQFFDFDTRTEACTDFCSATNFFPLWAGLATREQAARMVEALERLIEPGGIAGTTEASRGPVIEERTPRQWDFPFGWAPHQMLIWEGLRNYGYEREASDLALRWIKMLTQNAIDSHGVLMEKYNVVTGSDELFAEYANQGSANEGFGWTNASYQLGLDLLRAEQRRELDEMGGGPV